MLRCFLLPLMALLASGPALTAADEAPPAPTLEAAYPGLSSGPLRQARLLALPEGVLARAAGMVVKEAEVAARIAEAGDDAPLRRLLEKNAPYLVEKLVTDTLLAEEARAWALAQGKPTQEESPGSLVETYLHSLAAQAQVTPEEAKAFFAANQEMFGGATYDQVEGDLRTYLLTEKQDALVDAHVNSLSARTPVELNAAWFQAHAAAALDNPVDQARRSGKPALVDFGAGGCLACDRMTPLLEELGRDYGERAKVLFASVRDDPLLGARYNVRVIPLQVVFDAQGQEVFRHLGFWPREAMVAKLAELGVK